MVKGLKMFFFGPKSNRPPFSGFLLENIWRTKKSAKLYLKPSQRKKREEINE